MNIVKVLADKSTNRIPIGKQGENKATAVQFCVKTWLEMWPGATVALAVQPPMGNAYPAIVTTQDNITTWVITAADTVVPGIGKCELRVLLNDVVKKSITFLTYIAESFTADGEAPDPVTDWIEDAQAKLGEVDSAVDLIEGMTVSAAESTTPSATLTTVDGHYNIAFGLVKGDNGVSPIVTFSAITGGHRVTVTDADGTRTFDVMDGTDGRGIVSIAKTATSGLVDTYTITYTDNTTSTFTVINGKDGDEGYSPTIAVAEITGGHRVTVTNKSGSSYFDVLDGQPGQPGPGVPAGGTTGQMLVKKSDTDYDGEWENQPSVPVTDVQVNGVSVLNQGVANVPVASVNDLGVVKVDANSFGTAINGSGVLYLNSASESQVKTGTNQYRPLTPVRSDATAFYGLAKAAGANMASSSNPVGTYTDAAKSAISTMLNGPVTVSGTTPSITALPGIQYICGEVATLDITLPASGCVDVVFESGSTPTVLTVTPPTGVTVKWANGFDPTALEANTTYEIRVRNGQLASALAWA